MMTPIQAAVTMDRPSMVQVLLNYGASMPVVLVRHDDEAVGDAEDVARMLRVRGSFSYSTRSEDGRSGHSSSGLLP